MIANSVIIHQYLTWHCWSNFRRGRGRCFFLPLRTPIRADGSSCFRTVLFRSMPLTSYATRSHPALSNSVHLWRVTLQVPRFSYLVRVARFRIIWSYDRYTFLRPQSCKFCWPKKKKKKEKEKKKNRRKRKAKKKAKTKNKTGTMWQK